MPASHKKVIVRRFSGDLLHGYLPASGLLQHGRVDLLGLDGRRLDLSLQEVRSVAFVRDFTLGDLGVGERSSRKAFSTRPRGDGLWLRLTFRQDGDEVEGLAAADLALLDDLLRDAGLFFTPPDTRGNTQRLFVPRSAIAELRLLGVITPSAKRRGPLTPTGEIVKNPSDPSSQGILFRPTTPAPSEQPQSNEQDREQLEP